MNGPLSATGGIAHEELMTRTKVVRAFFQRISKLNAPQGGKISPGGEATDASAATTGHEPNSAVADEAVQSMESGLIQRKF
jgi:hypothetical protein